MLVTLIMSISILVLINFLLLKFSCNKTVKKFKEEKQAHVLQPQFTTGQESENLAPTGS